MKILGKAAFRGLTIAQRSFLGLCIPPAPVDLALVCLWATSGLTLTAHFVRLGYGVAIGLALGSSG
jgi:hypothetical protein